MKFKWKGLEKNNFAEGEIEAEEKEDAIYLLKEQGVTLWEWSAEDLGKFRAASQAAWPEFATTPEAKALVASHMEYLTQLGLVK